MQIRSTLLIPALAVALGLTACGPHVPPRPASVPQEAQWLGDRKGGVFVLIGAQEMDGWRLKIYDDHTGALKADGPFVLRGMARAELSVGDLAFFDGQSIHLKDGAVLGPRPQR